MVGLVSREGAEEGSTQKNAERGSRKGAKEASTNWRAGFHAKARRKHLKKLGSRVSREGAKGGASKKMGSSVSREGAKGGASKEIGNAVCAKREAAEEMAEHCLRKDTFLTRLLYYLFAPLRETANAKSLRDTTNTRSCPLWPGAGLPRNPFSEKYRSFPLRHRWKQTGREGKARWHYYADAQAPPARGASIRPL